MDEKIGGYDAKLTPRTRQMRDENIAYYEGYESGQADFHPENVELAKEILGSLDMKVLKAIFREHLLKSGVPLENSNEAVLDRIFVYPMESNIAEYQSFENVMSFSTSDKHFLEAKLHKTEQRTIPQELLMKMQLFFIHEACHVFSRERIYSTDVNAPQSRLHQDSGYRMANYTYGEHESTRLISSSFEAFNEGVTQRIAEEIFLEYHRRAGKSGEADCKLGTFTREQSKSYWSYFLYSNQVGSMCDSIAEYTGVPAEEVWKSFKRGYFEKPELFHEETAELFEETFGKDFLAEYSKMGRTTPVRDLARFDAKYKLLDPDRYTEKWLRHLGIVKG
ncbi:hypothetical protein HY971_01915 [Candidatus Kaiserbacteria bacterium]|nr:hypothetical protein [Candidatus Kaiserbacteria bacterium]